MNDDGRSSRHIDRRRLLSGAAGLVGGTLAGSLDAIPAHASSGDGARVAALQAGVERAEGVRAVKRLEHAYAHYRQFGLWKEAAGLFAREALVVGPEGRFAGAPAVGEHLKRKFGEGLAPGQLASSLVLSPVVNLAADGRSAKGRWHELSMLGDFGRRADWAGGIYENEYVLENGVWKIAAQTYYGRFSGPYQDGWRTTSNGGEVVPFHYDPRGAGTPIPRAEAPPPPLRATSMELAHRVAELSARIRRMNDESLVQNLQHAYGFYVDRKMWDDASDLFADDGVMELGGEGAYVGRASIRRGLDRFGPAGLRTGELNDHAQVDMVVTVAPDGLTARARGLELGMTGVNDQWARWSIGVFENTYVKQGGVWKISGMRLYPRMACAYDLGWGKDAQAPAQPSTAVPPDRPPSSSPAPYPEVSVPPFSFAHPVTGPRSPPVAIELAGGLDRALAEAERTLAVAKAYDGAENVCHAYGYYLDEFAWDETADIFARNGWKELSYVGTYVGRERIRASLKKRYGPGGRKGPFMTLHQKIQPVVTVAPDGQSAQVRERLFQMNASPNAPGSYIGGIYEDQCVLEDGVWKIAGMDLDYVWISDYADGWGHVNSKNNNRFAPPASFLKELPPDRPLRGVTFAPFPKIAPIGFHYRNPVSGRAPALLLP